ncbi:MAG: hypothetical protein ACTSR2_02550 [Candidatus Hodarchaeales archaeon]
MTTIQDKINTIKALSNYIEKSLVLHSFDVNGCVIQWLCNVDGKGVPRRKFFGYSYEKSDKYISEESVYEQTVISEYEIDKTVRINEESEIGGTGGHFRVHPHSFTVTQGQWSTYDMKHPYAISLLEAYFHSDGNSGSDKIKFVISPDTIIGAITSNVSSGDTDEGWVSVQESVITNIKLGYLAKLDDNTNNEEYIVGDIDVENNKIRLWDYDTMDWASFNNSYSASTPTYVKMGISMVLEGDIQKDSHYYFGRSKIGGSLIPANTTIRCYYYNGDTSDKKISFTAEYLY